MGHGWQLLELRAGTLATRHGNNLAGCTDVRQRNPIPSQNIAGEGTARRLGRRAGQRQVEDAPPYRGCHTKEQKTVCSDVSSDSTAKAVLAVDGGDQSLLSSVGIGTIALITMADCPSAGTRRVLYALSIVCQLFRNTGVKSVER